MTQPAFRPQPGEVVAFPTPPDARDDIQTPRDGGSTLRDELGDYEVTYLASLEPQQLDSFEPYAERKYLEASIANFTAWGHAAEARMAQAQLDNLLAALAAAALETP
jgi:hypothetical protein